MDARQVAVVAGIAVLLPLFLVLALEAVYSEPQYQDFCKVQMYLMPPGRLAENCSTDFAPAYYDCLNSGGQPNMTVNNLNCQEYFNCDTCNQEYNTARSAFEKISFIILAVVGFAFVVAGLYYPVEFIGVGFMFGGIITMFYATVRFFSVLDKFVRPLVILAELLLIIWIAYRKIVRKKKKPRF